MCVCVCSIIQPYIYHLVYPSTRYLFWEKLATKPEYLHCKPYLSVLRYRVVVPSFIGSAKEEKPLPPYLLEYFFPYSATLDFNIFSPLKLSINPRIHLLPWDLFWIYPNRHLLVQNQERKQQNIRNKFKVDNKDNKMTSMSLTGFSLVDSKQISHIVLVSSIVDFE